MCVCVCRKERERERERERNGNIVKLCVYALRNIRASEVGRSELKSFQVGARKFGARARPLDGQTYIREEWRGQARGGPAL